MSTLQTNQDHSPDYRSMLWQRLWERLLRPLLDEDLDGPAHDSPLSGHGVVAALDTIAAREEGR